MKWGTNLDLNKMQILNAVAQNLASAPSSPVKGLFYFDTISNDLFVYNGTVWKNSSGSVMTGASIVAAIVANAAVTGTGNVVFDNSPTLITPILGAATATSINKVTITQPASSATLTIGNTKTLTVNNTLTFAGTDGTTLTMPAATDTLLGRTSTDVLTNKSLSDLTTFIIDSVDNTKKLQFDITGTTGITGILQTQFTTAKTISFPDVAGTVTVLGNAVNGTGNIVLTNSPTFTGTVGLPYGSTSDGLISSLNAAVAAAGTNQGNAATLTKDINIVTSGTGGVVVPGATSGKFAVIVNKTGSAINVYPASGHYFDALAVNIPISLPAGGFLEMYGYSNTQWTTTLTAIIDWSKIINGPASTPTNIDLAVTNNHTHGNKTLLDTYTQAEVNLASAVSLKHTQNTDNTLTGSGVMVINTTGAGNIVDFKVNSVTKVSFDANGKLITGTVDWASLNNKPTSSVANLDLAVTNSHTHGNKTLLDTYTQTEVNLASAVSLKHAINTDTGTNNASFLVGTSGVLLKNSGGTELQLRNAGDTGYVDIRVNNIYQMGTTTSFMATTVNLGDSNLELNTNNANNAGNTDGGFTVKRFKVDNVTRADAVFNFNNSTGRFEGIFGPVASVVTAKFTNMQTFTIGDGSASTFLCTHNLGNQFASVTIIENTSPPTKWITDVDYTSTNSLTVKFGFVPTSNQFTVLVVG